MPYNAITCFQFLLYICMTCLVYLIMIICEFSIYGLMCCVAFDMLLIEINLRFSFPLAGAFLQSSAGRRCWVWSVTPAATMASTLPEHCWMERPWDGPGRGAGAGIPSPHQAFLPQAQLLSRRRPGASAASWSEEAPPVTNLRLGRR